MLRRGVVWSAIVSVVMIIESVIAYCLSTPTPPQTAIPNCYLSVIGLAVGLSFPADLGLVLSFLRSMTDFRM